MQKYVKNIVFYRLIYLKYKDKLIEKLINFYYEMKTSKQFPRQLLTILRSAHITACPQLCCLSYAADFAPGANCRQIMRQ